MKTTLISDQIERPNKKNKPAIFRKLPLLVSLAVSVLTIGIRQVGLLNDLERSTYDQFISWQPMQPPDPRLLVVGIEEEDISKYGTSDQVLDNLLQKLSQYQPRVIGLDIFRDIPQEPGNIELTSDLQTNNKIIATCTEKVAPPPVVPKARIGFSDFVIENNQTVRRNLLSISPNSNSKCPVGQSFGLLISLEYLSQEGIKSQPNVQDNLQIKSTIFKSLENNFGGYKNIPKDMRGYQTLLKYRAPKVAEQVTMSQVLKGELKPEQIKDRIVLIGYTAESKKDFFYTPYSAGQPKGTMPGIVIHAQMISQILSSVLDNRPLIWAWNVGVEFIWILGWTALGATLFTLIRKPLLLIAIIGLVIVVIVGICYAIFTFASGWVPLMPTVLSLGTTLGILTLYKLYLKPSVITNLPPAAPNGRYEIISNLGEGGFATTYKAIDKSLPGQPACVVKKLNMDYFDEATLEKAKHLFRQEAEVLNELGEHNQIPRLLAQLEGNQEISLVKVPDLAIEFQANKQFFLVEEFIQGQTLRQILKEGTSQPPEVVIKWLLDILLVLDFIHRRGVIHLDIKPANLILREFDGKIVVIDFGAVKILQEEFTQMTVQNSPRYGRTVIIATRGYASPEQVEGQPIPSSDIYALGIVGIEALTGTEVTELSNLLNSPDFWQSISEVSEKLAAILNKMVKPNTEERYQSAQEIIKELEELQI